MTGAGLAVLAGAGGLPGLQAGAVPGGVGQVGGAGAPLPPAASPAVRLSRAQFTSQKSRSLHLTRVVRHGLTTSLSLQNRSPQVLNTTASI